MPTFFRPGGRTFAGGDIMPLVMPWPKADADIKSAAKMVRIRFELLVIFSTVNFLGQTIPGGAGL